MSQKDLISTQSQSIKASVSHYLVCKCVSYLWDSEFKLKHFSQAVWLTEAPVRALFYEDTVNKCDVPKSFSTEKAFNNLTQQAVSQ